MMITDAIKNLYKKITGDDVADKNENQIAALIQELADHWPASSGGETATVDTLEGATDIGKSLMKATSAEAARTAIGAGAPYTLPAAGNDLGGVKKAAAVTSVSAENAGTIGAEFAQAEVQKVATLADANKTAINAIITNLKAAGIMA